MIPQLRHGELRLSDIRVDITGQAWEVYHCKRAAPWTLMSEIGFAEFWYWSTRYTQTIICVHTDDQNLPFERILDHPVYKYGRRRYRPLLLVRGVVRVKADRKRS